MKTKNSNQKTGVNIQASYDAYDLNGLPKKVNDNISAKIAANVKAVSYTHLTLPTTSRV